MMVRWRRRFGQVVRVAGGASENSRAAWLGEVAEVFDLRRRLPAVRRCGGSRPELAASVMDCIGRRRICRRRSICFSRRSTGGIGTKFTAAGQELAHMPQIQHIVFGLTIASISNLIGQRCWSCAWRRRRRNNWLGARGHAMDYGNAILGSLRPGMVYVGGTDDGRFVPELMNEPERRSAHHDHVQKRPGRFLSIWIM